MEITTHRQTGRQGEVVRETDSQMEIVVDRVWER